MEIFARDIATFSGEGEDSLGDRLSSRFKELDVDSVKEVRELRERE
ncbi:hypothetical protein [Candidatus Nanohalobium constans]|nr:hypothetical protein [Candidatus Nanohalobium constans]